MDLLMLKGAKAVSMALWPGIYIYAFIYVYILRYEELTGESESCKCPNLIPTYTSILELRFSPSETRASGN